MSHESEKSKLCVYCEGRVPLDSTGCPYCGAELLAEPFGGKLTHPHDTTDFLYEPPYKSSLLYKKEPVFTAPLQETLVSNEKFALLPVILFSLGTLFIAMGLLFLLLSSRKLIAFEFNTRLWPLYLLSGLPMAFFGFRRLLKDIL